METQIHLISTSVGQRGLWGLELISISGMYAPTSVCVCEKECPRSVSVPLEIQERAVISQSCFHASADLSLAGSLSHENSPATKSLRLKGDQLGDLKHL